VLLLDLGEGRVDRRGVGDVAPHGDRTGALELGGQLAGPARDGDPVAVTLTLGLDDDTNTEVVSGDLQESDRVIVSETRKS